MLRYTLKVIEEREIKSGIQSSNVLKKLPNNVSNDSEQALLSKVIVAWNRHSGSLWEHLEGR